MEMNHSILVKMVCSTLVVKQRFEQLVGGEFLVETVINKIQNRIIIALKFFNVIPFGSV